MSKEKPEPAVCPYCGNEPIPTGAGAKVMCNNLKCPIYAHECTPWQWNRRYVCDDHRCCCNTCDHKCGIELIKEQDHEG